MEEKRISSSPTTCVRKEDESDQDITNGDKMTTTTANVSLKTNDEEMWDISSSNEEAEKMEVDGAEEDKVRSSTTIVLSKNSDASQKGKMKKRDYSDMASPDDSLEFGGPSILDNLIDQLQVLKVEEEGGEKEEGVENLGQKSKSGKNVKEIHDMSAVAVMIGRRLSVAISEIMFYMRHGRDSLHQLEGFRNMVLLRSFRSEEETLVSRRIVKVMNIVDHMPTEHNVQGALPAQVDSLFRHTDFGGLVNQCSMVITDTDNLLSLQTILEDLKTPKLVLVKERLSESIDKLRAMHERILQIEDIISKLNTKFCDFNGRAAQQKVLGFIDAVEETLESLWCELQSSAEQSKRARI